MKKTLTLIAIIIGLNCKAQVTKTVFIDPYTKQYKQEQYTLNNNGVLIGNYSYFYQTTGDLNKIHFLFKFKDGILQEETEYFTNGKIKHTKSLLTGIYIAYYPNGKKKFEATFNKTKINYLPSTSSLYILNASKWVKIGEPFVTSLVETMNDYNVFPYTKIIYYYENGVLHTENLFDLETFISKKCVEYDEKGIKIFDRIRVDEKKYELTYYDYDVNIKNKFLKVEYELYNNKQLLRQGIEQYYDTTGLNPTGFRNYTIGKRNGIAKVYFNSDWEEIPYPSRASYYREIKYKNDSIDGIVKDYYITGELQGEAFLISEDPDKYKGLMKSFYKNGKTSYEVTCDEKGKPNGEEKKYDENGNLTEHNFYTSGTLQTGKTYNEKAIIIEEISFVEKRIINNWVDIYYMKKFDENGKQIEEGEFYFNKDANTVENEPIIKLGKWKNSTEIETLKNSITEIDKLIAEKKYNEAQEIINNLITDNPNLEVLKQKSNIIESIKKEIINNKQTANEINSQLGVSYGYLAVVDSPKSEVYRKYIESSNTLTSKLSSTKIISEQLDLSREYLQISKEAKEKLK